MNRKKKKLSLGLDTLRQLTESESQALNGGAKIGFACTGIFSVGLGGGWKRTRTIACTAPMSVPGGGGGGTKPGPQTTAPAPFC